MSSRFHIEISHLKSTGCLKILLLQSNLKNIIKISCKEERDMARIFKRWQVPKKVIKIKKGKSLVETSPHIPSKMY